MSEFSELELEENDVLSLPKKGDTQGQIAFIRKYFPDAYSYVINLQGELEEKKELETALRGHLAATNALAEQNEKLKIRLQEAEQRLEQFDIIVDAFEHLQNLLGKYLPAVAKKLPPQKPPRTTVVRELFKEEDVYVMEGNVQEDIQEGGFGYNVQTPPRSVNFEYISQDPPPAPKKSTHRVIHHPHITNPPPRQEDPNKKTIW